MTSSPPEQDARILVPVDALLDTRMGTAYRLEPSAVADLLRANYWHRTTNDLTQLSPRLNAEQYSQLWRNRDMDTLKVSLVSHFLDVLKTMILQRAMDSIEQGGGGLTGVKINLHPYHFETADELMLIQICRELLPEDVQLELCRVSLVEMSPRWLREERMDAFVVLDFVEWFQTHSDNLLAHPIPGVECFCPELIEDMAGRLQRALLTGEIDYDIQQHTDPFQLIRMILAGVVMITFLPIAAFSLPGPPQPTAETGSPMSPG